MRKECKDQGLLPIDKMSKPEMKKELDEILKNAATYFSALAVGIQSHYDALDESTTEDALNDATLIIGRMSKMVASWGSEHYNISYVYAFLYMAHCSNNSLMLDDDWKEYLTTIKTVFDMLDGKPKNNILEGYA